MGTITGFLTNYQYIVIPAILVLLLIILFMEILNRVELNRMDKRYKKLMKGSTGKNIEEMIMEYKAMVDESLNSVKNIENLYANIENKVKNSIQKFSIVRYRAFDDVGSDLSFSIALLDENDDGVVLTGIYGRNECTTFAKPVEKGISKYDLSEEEKLSIRNAINNRK